MDSPELDGFRACYVRIISPLQRLRGLRRFFAHLPYPGSCRSSRPPGGVCVKSGRLESLEGDLERSIMGEGYDAGVMGKGQLKRSRWMEDQDKNDPVGYWYE